ncbi:hypothetical protein ZIOFF_037985 [Zingiber officinale]|uniref:SAUR family protein n=1 Tax=Zingiber officinale TaxID=94328 RepID=A0A8J5GC93_ZINOF|nr:hypothetical protein ZIOFF_037985 [Zingiber officinale]
MLHLKLCKTFLRRWRELIKETMTYVHPARYSRHCVKEEGEEDKVPKDVPKGHLVVYVGEHCRRFIIDLAFLQHPLFRGLLELAQEEFDYLSPGGKLCIPSIFGRFASAHAILESLGRLHLGGEAKVPKEGIEGGEIRKDALLEHGIGEPLGHGDTTRSRDDNLGESTTRSTSSIFVHQEEAAGVVGESGLLHPEDESESATRAADASSLSPPRARGHLQKKRIRGSGLPRAMGPIVCTRSIGPHTMGFRPRNPPSD